MSSFENVASQMTKKWIRMQLQPNANDLEFRNRIKGGIETIRRHAALDVEMVLSFVPVDDIHQNAQQRHEKDSILYIHALIKSLLEWFKTKFFTWVDTLPCTNCGEKTENAGSAQPTTEDLQYGANRVEIHHCTKCNIDLRFPRYNHVEKLLVSRKGRCGEWANTFTAILRAFGFETRYVLDFTDHVWTEFYCTSERRWIPMDSCENSFDEPLMYEVGWGKKLNYVIAFGDYVIKDVTLKHTRDFSQLLSRRSLGPENHLKAVLALETDILRVGLSPQMQEDLEQMDMKEDLDLLKSDKKANEALLRARQSGSLEWKLARGEMGQS